MDYGRLVSRAFTITLRHRFLWWLGIVAALGGSGFNLPNPSSFSEEPFEQSFQQIEQWVLAHLALVIVLAMLLFLLLLALLVLSVMARAGLISAVAALEREQPTDFGRALRVGYSAFWRIVAISLLVGLALLGILALLAAPVVVLALTKIYWAAVLLGMLFSLCFIAVALYAGVLWLYATRSIVIEGSGASASLARGHETILRFKGESALIWLIAFAVSLAIGIGVLVAVGVVAALLGLAGYGLYHVAGLIPTVIYGVLFGLLLLAGLLFLSGLAAVYQSAYWTLAYLELTGRAAATATSLPPTPPETAPD